MRVQLCRSERRDGGSQKRASELLPRRIVEDGIYERGRCATRRCAGERNLKRRRGTKRMPQVDHSTDHHAYRCYRQGPDGFRELSICEPGAPREATPAGGTQSTSELADSLRVWKMPDPRSSTRDQIDRNRIAPQSVNSCEPSPSSLEPTDCGALHLLSLSPRNRLERVPRTPAESGS